QPKSSDAFKRLFICSFLPVPGTSQIVNSWASSSTSITVTWETVPSADPGADSYLATLEDSNGRGTTCQGTTEGSCNVTGLACGQIYHVSVVSSDGYCDSPPTPETDTPSGRTKVTNGYIKDGG
uniref:Fibronectin type-III domain-containing protein n=1 Tax=Acanthochromis polyacanthus TaxID=80966 RepID=A0A3Q1GG40_9TELE